MNNSIISKTYYKVNIKLHNNVFFTAHCYLKNYLSDYLYLETNRLLYDRVFTSAELYLNVQNNISEEIK